MNRTMIKTGQGFFGGLLIRLPLVTVMLLSSLLGLLFSLPVYLAEQAFHHAGHI